ncbi:hypothetical protein EMIHUDRAFT_214881 [Emiliania huxleyi CCMP1516]|uniref:Uncharacterized protein n=2 Tax=Emiliania huxleyi TaxID=2903 RepID=A0A0D3IIJ5_EMIH1|nr:hypothetical protein EMIHUDRAFT_214881 [Emiliania huxleyi CCMP1516]EOD11080.1 hypothetical protein EMIHUDRAFT_214881 [Emiliania huxleyi CCMP1516]|eukprot:XP_005763509.1 hypothetical protein EMIHUDRAFT_214881 [Emiliania huxleyi CCMP1516]
MPRPDVDRPAGLDARRLVAFKACVDELSRLSAGRGEDGALLAQISHDGAVGLSSVSKRSDAAQLLIECRYRDEWRQQRCASALASIGAERDAAVVERMCEYVGALSPDGAEPGAAPKKSNQSATPQTRRFSPPKQQQQQWQRIFASLVHADQAAEQAVIAAEADGLGRGRTPPEEYLAVVAGQQACCCLNSGVGGSSLLPQLHCLVHDLPASLLCLAAALLLLAEPLQLLLKALRLLLPRRGTGWDGATATATKRLAGFTTSAVTTLRPRLVALPCGG